MKNKKEKYSIPFPNRKTISSMRYFFTHTKKALRYRSAFLFYCEQSISRVLSRLRGDDYLSRLAVADKLKQRYPEGQRATSTLPYSALLRMGFTKPSELPRCWCALTAPFHPYRQKLPAVSFSMALSLGSPPPAVSRHPALRSSDFPHAFWEKSQKTRNHLSYSRWEYSIEQVRTQMKCYDFMSAQKS